MGVMQSRWSMRNETSDWRAAGFVAGASPTGIETRPKLRDPFQEVRIEKAYIRCAGFSNFDLEQRTPPWLKSEA